MMELQKHAFILELGMVTVPDYGSQDRDVVLVRRITVGEALGWGRNLEWGGTREGLGTGRPVHEQPGAKVDGIAPHKERDSK